MWLLIDDVRYLNTVDAIARNADAGMQLLEAFVWDGLVIDHDLGEKLTGYDIVKWAAQNSYLPNKVQIISANPVGKKNIENVLEDNGYILKKQTWVNNLD